MHENQRMPANETNSSGNTHDHDDQHGHHDDHGHHGRPTLPTAPDQSRKFKLGITLNLGFVLVEAAAGMISGSLALLADAGHNLSDVLALLIAWGASVLVRRKPTPHFTYGLRGSSIWAAMANALILMVVCGGIAWEAIRRLHQPAEVSGMMVIVIAAIGVVINTATALLFMRGRHADLNLRGAFLHMAADAAISLGVVVTGLVMMSTEWYWLDPAISLAIVILIVGGTVGLLKDSMRLALHAVPPGIDPHAVKRLLDGMPGVTQTHDLHIWAMSTTETALTAHLVVPDARPGDEFYAEINRLLAQRFGIHHATIQIECGSHAHPCKLASDEVV